MHMSSLRPKDMDHLGIVGEDICLKPPMIILDYHTLKES